MLRIEGWFLGLESWVCTGPRSAEGDPDPGNYMLQGRLAFNELDVSFSKMDIT